ncbi:unnamed protein product [Protopolystoma xenopodis]|uniref:Uncharacterized protein n=1 Tax=Protopolystoma xenopodis TaxID=117903 RepID=A0A448XJB8_9PLAT|nr:unnamed protein product [Protopolystoma xenopodis]
MCSQAVRKWGSGLKPVATRFRARNSCLSAELNLPESTNLQRRKAEHGSERSEGQKERSRGTALKERRSGRNWVAAIALRDVIGVLTIIRNAAGRKYEPNLDKSPGKRRQIDLICVLETGCCGYRYNHKSGFCPDLACRTCRPEPRSPLLCCFSAMDQCDANIPAAWNATSEAKVDLTNGAVFSNTLAGVYSGTKPEPRGLERGRNCCTDEWVERIAVMLRFDEWY